MSSSRIVLFSSLLLVAGCGSVTEPAADAGAGIDADTTDGNVVPETYSVGGTVTGLVGSMTLQNNDGDDLVVDADGSFTFATELEDGASYEVTVTDNAGVLTCPVTGGSGTVSGADVTDVEIDCAYQYFFTGSNGTDGWELWKSDGTADGTVMVKDINAVAPGDGSRPNGMTAVGEEIFFAADDGVNGWELWKTDGTEVGTVMVTEISPPVVGGGPGNAYPRDFTVVGDLLFFTADNGNGRELWKSDGTAGGTSIVKKLNPNAGADIILMREGGGVLWFIGNDGSGRELWTSDGTANGTQMVRDINPNGAGVPNDWGVYWGGYFYFEADDGTNFRQLWRSDGTANGTTMVSIVTPGVDALIFQLSATDTHLFFTADNANREPWVSDGTDGGTMKLVDINPNAGSFPSSFVAIGGTMFFRAYDGSQSELWKSDGTSAGTSMVLDIGGTGQSGSPSRLFAWNDTLLFVANDGVASGELWKSDGTAGGTTMVKDIEPGADGSYPEQFFAVGDQVLFAARTAANDYELWITDGTAAGTVMLKELNPSGDGMYVPR